VLAALPSLGVTLSQNKAVTGSFTTLPYMLSRYQYGIPASFTFQTMPVPHRELTDEQKLDYQAQSDVHGDQPETIGTYLLRLAGRIRFLHFFFLAPLYVALVFFLPALFMGCRFDPDLCARHQYLSLLLPALHRGSDLSVRVDLGERPRAIELGALPGDQGGAGCGAVGGAALRGSFRVLVRDTSGGQ
jgi:hypothetical protein